jgi:hypothetical protein
MADESKLTVVHSYEDDTISLPNFGTINQETDVTTQTPVEFHEVSVATSEQVLNLGGVTAAKALIVIKNHDTSNYVEVRTATGAGNDAYFVAPGECHAWRFGTDVTAPYIIANSAACKVSYRLTPY